MASKFEKFAQQFADAVSKQFELEAGTVRVWDEGKCADKGYDNAKAGVVLEDAGLGAVSETEVQLESGYGRIIPLKGISKQKGIMAEPYASWLLLFYAD